MDPLTVIGGIAASTQLCGNLLAVIRLLRGLKDIPDEMAKLLKEVELDIASVERILQLGTPAFPQVSAAQADQIKHIAIEAHEAMQELHSQIKKHIPARQQNAGKMAKLTLSLKSLLKRDEFKAKMERVKRLASTLVVKLQCLGFETQLQINTQIPQIDSKIDTLSATISQHNDRNTATLGEVQTTVESLERIQSQETGPKLDALQVSLSGQSDQNTEILSEVRRTHNSVTTMQTINMPQIQLGIETNRNQLSALDQKTSEISATGNNTQASITAMETAVSRVESTAQSTAMTLKMLQSQFSAEQKQILLEIKDLPILLQEVASRGQPKVLETISELQKMLLNQMGSHNSRNKANLPVGIQRSSLDIDYHRRTVSLFIQSGQYCRSCAAGRNLRAWKYGPFRMMVRSQSKCPQHGSKRSWEYVISARLGPFLNTALEFALGGVFGAELWETKGSIRPLAIVRRSDSPLFVAFDCFRDKVRASIIRGRADLEKRNDFYGLIQDLKKELHTGRLLDTDISGNTVLFEALKIIDQFRRSYHFKDLSKSLFEVVFAAGANPAIQSEDKGVLGSYHRMNREPYYESRVLYTLSSKSTQFSGPVTAMDYFLGICCQVGNDDDSIENLYFPCIEIAKEFSDFMQSSDRKLPGINAENLSPVKLFRLLQIFPALALELDNSEINGIILNRDLNALQISLLCDSWSKLGPLRLALDWPEGLEELCRYGAARSTVHSEIFKIEFQNTFDLACRIRHVRAITILLQCDYPVFTRFIPNSTNDDDQLNSLWTFQFAALSSSSWLRLCNPLEDTPAIRECCRTIVNLVVTELRSRRQKVNDLALKHLDADQLDRFKISAEKILDEHAEEVFHVLEGKITIPSDLHCCQDVNLYHQTIKLIEKHFHFDGNGRIATENIRLLDTIYEAGFTAVDVRNSDGKTPLFMLLEVFSRNKPEWLDSHTEPQTGFMLGKLVNWFLERGATQAHMTRSEVPFYATFAIDKVSNSDNTSQQSSELLEATALSKTIRSALRCEDFSDSCKCFCSNNGCIPEFRFWRCGNHALTYRVRLHTRCGNQLAKRAKALSLWLESFYRDISKEKDQICRNVYRDLYRLDLFERLGMTHTCCATRDDTLGLKHDERERKRERIQSEESSRARILDLLLFQYGRMRAHYFDESNEEFSSIWEKTVDQILPPLLPEEACQRRLVPQIRFLDHTEGDWNMTKEEEKEFLAKKHQEVSENRKIRCQMALKIVGYEAITFEDVITLHFDRALGLPPTEIRRRTVWSRIFAFEDCDEGATALVSVFFSVAILLVSYFLREIFLDFCKRM